MEALRLGAAINATLFGVAIGDALGVPVEFQTRKEISKKPVKDMIGFGTHNQPPGTWSDDSSLTFCLAEALTQSFNLTTIGQNFVKWYYQAYWTAHGEVFDVGIATRKAIAGLVEGVRPDLAGGIDVSSNGNGSLMRILPLAFYIKDRSIHERYELIKQVSSITHAHIRSVIACFYYIEFALQLLNGCSPSVAYINTQSLVSNHLFDLSINPDEIVLFDRLLKHNIAESSEDDILSSGYVVHTLEASIWCLLTTNSYETAVLKAINLGDDTDTTGAVTGGLASLAYGFDSIPARWVAKVARNNDINELAKRLTHSLTN